MKTSTKTKTARIVIGELPSAGTSGPLNLNSAAVATVHGDGGGFRRETWGLGLGWLGGSGQDKYPLSGDGNNQAI